MAACRVAPFAERQRSTLHKSYRGHEGLRGKRASRGCVFHDMDSSLQLLAETRHIVQLCLRQRTYFCILLNEMQGHMRRACIPRNKVLGMRRNPFCQDKVRMTSGYLLGEQRGGMR